MKTTLKVILSLVFAFILVNIHSQDYFKTIGDASNYYSVLLIKVYDYDTRSPIRNAEITLESDIFRYKQKLYTRDGVAAIIFKFWGDSDYKDVIGEVIHQDYSYRTFEISRYDLASETNRTHLHLPNYEQYEPTSSEIANELRLGRYNVNGRNLMADRNHSVGCYVLELGMQKIRRSSRQYDNQQDYNRQHDNRYDSRNNYQSDDKPKEVLITCDRCNGTGVCQYCAGAGKIYFRANSDSYKNCTKCRSTGKCPYCGGRGKVVKHK